MGSDRVQPAHACSSIASAALIVAAAVSLFSAAAVSLFSAALLSPAPQITLLSPSPQIVDSSMRRGNFRAVVDSPQSSFSAPGEKRKGKTA